MPKYHNCKGVWDRASSNDELLSVVVDPRTQSYPPYVLKFSLCACACGCMHKGDSLAPLHMARPFLVGDVYSSRQQFIFCYVQATSL